MQLFGALTATFAAAMAGLARALGGSSLRENVHARSRWSGDPVGIGGFFAPHHRRRKIPASNGKFSARARGVRGWGY